MKDKLLAALKLKFTGVSDATLERIAIKKAVSVKEEAEIQVLVDAMTVDTIIQSETDFKITEANRKAVENYEAKHGLKDGKPLEAKPAGKPTDPAPNPDEPAWFTAYKKEQAEQTRLLNEKLENQEKEKTSAALAEKVRTHEKLKDIPASFLKGRNLTPSSEAEIDQLVASIETDYNGFKQEMTEKGVFVSPPPDGGGKLGEKATIDSYLADKFPVESKT